ncbi:DinB family protein [Flavobacterium sedimenticola]|uniref:DinB family protein n=1 Tax=Flavobacterium sedimenticola TaxID=3043286 RepID=A0ABT6XNZ0_9FLAO|nr:DinB family protein [Flavobacterium sedimenticola]MDI9256806.1 DinB family protein [Flavobacterium sedimenticola]
MEVTSIQSFVNYYKKVRETTNTVIRVIPREYLEFSYKEGKFTIADLLRHIAAIERHLFAEIIQGNKPTYTGCGKELAEDYDDIMNYLNTTHRETLDIINRLEDADLQKKIKPVSGTEIKLSSFLRALTVHEIHHRATLCIYLNMLGITTPPILGLTAEQVITISNKP